MAKARRVRGSPIARLEGRRPALLVDPLVTHERAKIGIANHLAADRANHVALRVALIGHWIRGALRCSIIGSRRIRWRHDPETLGSRGSRRRPLNTRKHVEWLRSRILAVEPAAVNWTKVSWTKVAAMPGIAPRIPRAGRLPALLVTTWAYPLRSSLVRLDVLGFQRRFAFNPRRIGHLGPKN